ncbi:hypothetical protein D8N35_06695 [Enterococcus casseliflavus]|nr:hypothetical protein D8N35_06695 [Enterococcus casseliflavus]
MNPFNYPPQIILLIIAAGLYHQLSTEVKNEYRIRIIKKISVFLLSEYSCFLVPFLDIPKLLKTLIYQCLLYFPS